MSINLGGQGLGAQQIAAQDFYSHCASTHYTTTLAAMLKAMSIEDLVKEAQRNPFEAEILRRREEAEQRLNSAHEHKASLIERIEEARERFKHL